MQQHGVRRLISTTGVGVRDPQDQPKPVDHLMKGLLTLMAGAVLRDSAANVDVIRSSNLDWTIVRFPRLTDGPHTGKYRVGYLGKGSGTQLSRADGADFVLKELSRRQIHPADAGGQLLTVHWSGHFIELLLPRNCGLIRDSGGLS